MGIANLFGRPRLLRQSKFAGQLYPASKKELSRQTESATGATTRNARAIVVPHSDPALVGEVTAAAFRRLAPAQRVVIIGPAHKVPFAGVAVPNADGWKTPLGTSAVDVAAYAGVEDLDLVRVLDAVFDAEPAVELQVPWVQTTHRGARLVPLLCGDVDPGRLLELLDRLVDDETVVVVAAELAWDRDESDLQASDEATLDAIEAGHWDSLRSDRTTARSALSALLRLAERRRWRYEQVLYRTSHDLGHPDHLSAGYAALAFTGEAE